MRGRGGGGGGGRLVSIERVIRRAFGNCNNTGWRKSGWGGKGEGGADKLGLSYDKLNLEPNVKP